jgi:hypothetical protein
MGTARLASGRDAAARGRLSRIIRGDLARRLWEISEELTGVSFPLGPGAAGSGRAQAAYTA